MSEVQFKRKQNRLRVAGEMTIYTAAQAKAELLCFVNGESTPDLDLSEVSEFDSAGFQLLALCRREAAERGATLRLSACSEAVKRVLDAYHVADWFSGRVAKRARRRSNAQEG